MDTHDPVQNEPDIPDTVSDISDSISDNVPDRIRTQTDAEPDIRRTFTGHSPDITGHYRTNRTTGHPGLMRPARVQIFVAEMIRVQR